MDEKRIEDFEKKAKKISDLIREEREETDKRIKLNTNLITVKRTSLYADKRRETIKVYPFETSPMYISLKVGRTIPQPYGHYAKTEVTISMPCYVEELKDVYEEIKNKVHELLDEQITLIEKENETIERK
jgi:hypothetical protein